MDQLATKARPGKGKQGKNERYTDHTSDQENARKARRKVRRELTHIVASLLPVTASWDPSFKVTAVTAPTKLSCPA